MEKSYKKVYIFYLTNISRAMVLPLTLTFDAFEAKSIGQLSDIDQSSFQIVYLSTIELAIILLLASTVFLI